MIDFSGLLLEELCRERHTFCIEHFGKEGFLGESQEVPFSSKCEISVAGNQLGYSSCLDQSPSGEEERDLEFFFEVYEDPIPLVSCRQVESILGNFILLP